MRYLIFTALAAAGLLQPASAFAQSSEQTLTLSGERLDFDSNRGSLSSATLEYKLETGDTTVVLTPTVGRREIGGSRFDAIGGGATVYQAWSRAISTRTSVFLAEDEPVFASRDLAQDVTFLVLPKTAITMGGRWARYFGGRDVTFWSAGVRQYFAGGSVSYRVTQVDPEGSKAFLAHLINVSISDGHNRDGKTRLWLSTGAASLANAQFDQGFRGRDRSALVQRDQPLTSRAGVIASAGLSSYALPTGRIEATNFSLGLRVNLGGKRGGE